MYGGRIRPSILELQTKYENGDKKPLEDLMRAWKCMKAKDPNDPTSFFSLGGFHGMPFRGEGQTNSDWWGGYCHHGNVLFPTWHRVYLLKLEESLRSSPGCEEVSLPYWDETDEYSLKNGLPWVFTVENFTVDGEIIPNPIRSFVLPLALVDKIEGNESLTKPFKYETKRYPLAALVGTPEAALQTEEHNKLYPDPEKNTAFLNQNVVAWLNQQVLPEFKSCLEAPNYTVFSNTTSSSNYNSNNPGQPKQVPLESPHNHVHLSIGGFEAPQDYKTPQIINGASGDMGENETAGFDPIFFFHHCNIDRVFWLWQMKNKSTDTLEIIPGDPGTKFNSAQGPTPGFNFDTILDLNTPLTPFLKVEDGKEKFYISQDCINIEKQLGYTYSSGSLEADVEQNKLSIPSQEQVTKLKVSNINRAQLSGSFLIEAYLPVSEDEVRLLGVTSVLSRWNVKNCKNCQNKLEVQAFFNIPNISGLENPKPFVKITSRHGSTKKESHGLQETPELFVLKNIEKEVVYELI